MNIYEIDWTKDDVFAEIEKYHRSIAISNVQKLDEIRAQLKDHDMFNHVEFRKIRAKLGSQQEWADQVGVSQATIGNYERNVTYPGKPVRRKIIDAIDHFRAQQVSILESGKRIEADVDPVAAKEALEHSILDAALTDFDFDPEEQKVVAVVFDEDVKASELQSLEQDRRDLFSALNHQGASIADSLRRGSNAPISRLVDALEDYSAETSLDRPNPRKLFRWGSNISRALASDDIS